MKLYEFKMPHPVGTVRGATNSLKAAISKACTGTVYCLHNPNAVEELELCNCDDIEVQCKYTGRVYPVRFQAMQLDF